MNDNQDAQQDIASTLYEYIASFDKEIYADEKRREDSLIQQATNMQTAFSFVSAAVFMIATIAIDNRGKMSLLYLLVIFSIISALLLACLFCATMAQRRYKQHLFPYAKDFQSQVEERYTEFQTRAQREKYIAEVYAKSHKSLSDSNDNRVVWIQRSMGLFYVSLGVCVIEFTITLIILF